MHPPSQNVSTKHPPISLGRAAAGLVVLIVAGLILAAFAGLNPMGAWRPDEYHDFERFRSEGWSSWLNRLLTWSPRPLSEALIGLYFLAEETTRSQLIAPFLALMDLALLAGPALWISRARTHGSRLDRLMISAVILCLFLLGHPLAEVFYWPLGAVAYAITLAAITALTFQYLDGQPTRPSGQIFSIACVLVAAGSAEVGAIFAIFLSALMVLFHATGRLEPRRAAALWLMPLLLGIVVMIFLALGRGRLDEHISVNGIAANPRFQHHVWASIVRSVPTYFRQIATLDGTQTGLWAIGESFFIKLAMCLGLLAFFRGACVTTPARGSRLGLVALIFGLQATFIASIAGSYFKFGLVCCERHDTLRQCLFDLTALAGAALLSRLRPPPANPARCRAIGVALLGATLITLTIRELPALRAAYAMRHDTIAIQRANWKSGKSPGPRMTMLMAPLPPIVGGMMPPASGTFENGTEAPWPFWLLVEFFGKHQIELKPT